MNELDYKTLLKAEFESRRAKNRNYSLRAFSRQLAISPAQLSQLISGKRPLTPKTAAKISERLGYSPEERAKLVESTVPELREEGVDSLQQLREEEFRVIADWYHFAILSLSEIKRHKADPRWIASRLGISVMDAAAAIKRLERLGVIEISDGKIRQVRKRLCTSSDVPSAAIRRYHYQNLDKAKEKLDEVPVNRREYSAITMAIAPKQIPKAKTMITKFKRDLSSLLVSGEKKAVYTLAVQLFPVFQLEDK